MPSTPGAGARGDDRAWSRDLRARRASACAPPPAPAMPPPPILPTGWCAASAAVPRGAPCHRRAGGARRAPGCTPGGAVAGRSAGASSRASMPASSTCSTVEVGCEPRRASAARRRKMCARRLAPALAKAVAWTDRPRSLRRAQTVPDVRRGRPLAHRVDPAGAGRTCAPRGRGAARLRSTPPPADRRPAEAARRSDSIPRQKPI